VAYDEQLAAVEPARRKLHLEQPVRHVDVRCIDGAVAERPRDLDPARGIECREVVAEADGARRARDGDDDRAQRESREDRSAPAAVHDRSMASKPVPA
jgi:hypothetical protein